MKLHTKTITASLASSLLASGLCVSALAEEKPNIIFIFADDLCYDKIGCLAQDKIHTPNLDKLVKEGTHFTHAYNQGGWNGAISVASRAMINTGLNLWKAQEALSNKTSKPTTWSQRMKQAGYNTYITGKWHVEIPATSVFDQARNIRGGMPAQSKDCYDRKFIEGQEDKWKPYDTSYGGFWAGGRHWSAVVKDDALDYIESASQSDKPFFMYLAFNAPHDPRQAPKEYVDKHPYTEIETPATFLPQYPYAKEVGCGPDLRDEKLAPFPRTERSVQINRQEYYASTSYMDKQIGDILEALEKSGKKDNTYIIFTADHGLSVGDHGFIGKQNMYDAAMRVPLMIVGPNVPQGKKIDTMVYLQDAMASAVDLAGGEGLDEIDFQSFMPYVRDEETEGREVMYGGYMKLQRMVRTKEYKMILYPKAGVVRLYNMIEDPDEMKDLSGDKKYGAVMDELFQKLCKEQKVVGDPMDLAEGYKAARQKAAP